MLEGFDELAAEGSGEGLHGEEEVLPCAGPSAGVKGQHTAGDEAMQVDMVQQRLVPGA